MTNVRKKASIRKKRAAFGRFGVYSADGVGRPVGGICGIGRASKKSRIGWNRTGRGDDQAMRKSRMDFGRWWDLAKTLERALRRSYAELIVLCAVTMSLVGFGAFPAQAQENPLGEIHTQPPPPPPKSPEDSKPVVEGAGNVAANATSRRDARLRVDVNLVLVPATVTDPMNRLVTGLEKENFQVFDNNIGQIIKSFSTEDAPVTIGIVFDLSGSMNSKFNRARRALSEFLRTSNPLDEFFVVGFNDRPAVIVDYTSDIDDVEARMVMLKPENRTALIDAAYLGITKLRDAKYERKALLIISDGGDNRSRYTEGELRRAVRESDVQIYSIGIFDQYAPTQEEQLGPVLLSDICEMTGGRMFRVGDIADLGDIATRISAELRNEYVIA
jgi:Ca-activated chloride channel family protein